MLQPAISVRENSVAAQSSERRQKISRPIAAVTARGTMNAATMVT
jgi:hypothetical protein